MHALPTIERVKELLDYDPETGVLTWRVKRIGCGLGKQAGSKKGDGYYQVCIDRRIIPNHRLIWFYVTGQWPPRYIDHADGVKSNNKFSNLRLATPAQNGANSKVIKNKTVPQKGVSIAHKKYRAIITHKGYRIHLGVFNTPEEAHEVYMKASRDLNGEFARSE